MNFSEEHLEQLILDGIVEFAGLDKNGEMLYNFAPDLEQKAPEMHRLVQEMHMQDIYYLWQQGFLSMDITASAPLVTITKKALDDSELDKLPEQLRFLMEQLKEEMRKDS